MKTKVINKLKDLAILVVDKDKLFSKVIVRSLKHKGFRKLYTAANAGETCDFLNLKGTKKENKPRLDSNTVALVILDAVLPDGDGFEVCKKIKKNTNLPVIIMTEQDIYGIQHKISECRADDFLPKPFEMLELIARVTHLLGNNINRINKKLLKLHNSEVQKQGIPFYGEQINKYLIIDFLGWGASSIVYKVKADDNSKCYALKMLLRKAEDFKEPYIRFQNEIEIMSRIHHKNVVEFYDNGEFQNSHYLVMEFVEGVNLEKFMVTQGRITIPTLMPIIFGMSSSIAELHKLRIIHRDIKMSNFMYDTISKEVKLCDFGIAKLEKAETITRDGTIMGTPIYMAPEIYQGQTGTVKSDIYSFGATVYHLITDSPPFTAENTQHLAEKHYYEKAKPMKALRPDVPDELDDLIINKCLAKNPEMRLPSMKEVIKYLEKI